MDDLKNLPDEVKIGPLLANIGRMHAKRADQFMEQIGLYRGQAFLLMILARREGMTHSEIAERLEISPAAATKVIKRMEVLRYVRRQADPADERVSRVYLEAEGWAVIHKARKTFEQIDQALVSSLAPEEQKILIQLLMKVYTSLLEFSKA